jgi:hypothetical protein
MRGNYSKNDSLTQLCNVEKIGSVVANKSSTSASIELSKAVSDFKFIAILAIADGYTDIRYIPVPLLSTLSTIGGKGYNLRVYASDNYFFECNVGFYTADKKTAEVRTLDYAGWTATVNIYGIG